MAATAPQVARLAGPGIAAFLPTNAEPDIIPLLRRLPTPVFLPNVASGFELTWVRSDPAALQVVAHGIPRPTGPQAARGAEVAELVGAMLVPALAVDPKDGSRLGYGGGYYDRLLARLDPAVHVVGVCRDADLMPLPREEHDRTVALILTESGLRTPSESATRMVGEADSRGDCADG